MSWRDSNGVTHPNRSDEVTPWGNAHIAACRDCARVFGGPHSLGLIPLEKIGIPPAPTGRAKHRKEDQ